MEHTTYTVMGHTAEVVCPITILWYTKYDYYVKRNRVLVMNG